MIIILTIWAFSLQPLPLALPWGKVQKNVPKVEEYKYFFGDVEWGKIVYLGSRDIAELETEVHLEYTHNKLSSALLILGPSGLNDSNCIRKYKEVIGLLRGKYGDYKYQNITKDPLINDLLAAHPCHPVQVGLYEAKTTWFTPLFRIELDLFGEDDEFYIEIRYTLLTLEGKQKKQNMERMFRRL